MNTQWARDRADFIIAVLAARTRVGTSVDLPIWVQARRTIDWGRRDH